MHFCMRERERDPSSVEEMLKKNAIPTVWGRP